MNSKQIEEVIAPLGGVVVALDELKNVARNVKYVIVNTDNSDQPGQHWTCFVVKHNAHNKVVYYLDSLGVGPFLKEHVVFLNNMLRGGDEIICNKHAIQHANSDLCGCYVICLVIHMARGDSFDGFLARFGFDLAANDIIIQNQCPRQTSIKGGGQSSAAVQSKK